MCYKCGWIWRCICFLTNYARCEHKDYKRWGNCSLCKKIDHCIFDLNSDGCVNNRQV